MLEDGCQERKESKIELALLDLDIGMGTGLCTSRTVRRSAYGGNGKMTEADKVSSGQRPRVEVNWTCRGSCLGRFHLATGFPLLN
jgi:hypothetical protein